MRTSSIDLKILAIGFLLGLCLLLAAAQERSVTRYEIATATSTWIIDKTTGDVWQLNGERGTNKFTWIYAGKPTGKEPASSSPDY